jgi:hypothetical protein
MKTPAIIASFTVVGSIAYAAGSQGTAGKQPPVMPSGAQAHSMQEEMPQMRGGPSGNCEPLTEPWFSPIPREISYDCRFVAGRPLEYADVNGDGEDEYFLGGLTGTGFVQEGTPKTFPPYLVLQSRMPFPDAGGVHTHLSIFPSTSVIGESLKTLFPNIRGATAASTGWRDFDHDGDLDLLVFISLTFFGIEDNDVRPFWFENVGYEKPAPAIAADLNQDGVVNGADMGLLLYAWGPNQ